MSKNANDGEMYTLLRTTGGQSQNHVHAAAAPKGTDTRPVMCQCSRLDGRQDGTCDIGAVSFSKIPKKRCSAMIFRLMDRQDRLYDKGAVMTAVEKGVVFFLRWLIYLFIALLIRVSCCFRFAIASCWRDGIRVRQFPFVGESQTGCAGQQRTCIHISQFITAT